MDVFFGTDTSPSSGDSSPVIIRKMVVLPAPLGPTRPTFSPGFSWNDASTKMSCLPYCLLMFAREIIEGVAETLQYNNSTPERPGFQALARLWLRFPV